MARRVIITATIHDDEMDKNDIADVLPWRIVDDPTVWEWPEFWQDVTEGVVTTDADKTRTGDDKSVTWTEGS